MLVNSMAFILDGRTDFRLSIIMAGMMLCDDRRVAAAWFATVGVQDDWDRFYDCLISVGRNCDRLALPLAVCVLQKFAPGPGGHVTVADGAYASRIVIRPLLIQEVTVFSRLPVLDKTISEQRRTVKLP